MAGVFLFSRGFSELDLQVNEHYTFTLIAAHLKSRRPSAIADEEEWRYEEAAALRRVIDARFAQDPAQNLAVVGDFNDVAGLQTRPRHHGPGERRDCLTLALPNAMAMTMQTRTDTASRAASPGLIITRRTTFLAALILFFWGTGCKRAGSRMKPIF
jgi:endonuclease/exonuclease/phosphatase family metal-dependent hydrolase